MPLADSGHCGTRRWDSSQHTGHIHIIFLDGLLVMDTKQKEVYAGNFPHSQFFSFSKFCAAIRCNPPSDYTSFVHLGAKTKKGSWDLLFYTSSMIGVPLLCYLQHRSHSIHSLPPQLGHRLLLLLHVGTSAASGWRIFIGRVSIVFFAVFHRWIPGRK